MAASCPEPGETPPRGVLAGKYRTGCPSSYDRGAFKTREPPRGRALIWVLLCFWFVVCRARYRSSRSLGFRHPVCTWVALVPFSHLGERPLKAALRFVHYRVFLCCSHLLRSCVCNLSPVATSHRLVADACCFGCSVAMQHPLETRCCS